jgi:hypothetical protein
MPFDRGGTAEAGMRPQLRVVDERGGEAALEVVDEERRTVRVDRLLGRPREVHRNPENPPLQFPLGPCSSMQSKKPWIDEQE